MCQLHQCYEERASTGFSENQTTDCCQDSVTLHCEKLTRAILLTLTIFVISACGQLFDYPHTQQDPIQINWVERAKAECKKGGYEKYPNASYPGKPELSVEEANLQFCVDRKASELEKEWQAKRDKDRRYAPRIGFGFGLVFGL